MKQRVIIAMSGGVDSSTAAYLLVKQGYEVVGVNMKLPYTGEYSQGGCCGISGADDARRVAHSLNIPFYVLNYEQEFKRTVINNFCNEYAQGRTPNPCIVCNYKLKFGRLLEWAKTFDAQFIATGHYARIDRDQKSGEYLLKKGIDQNKDQSYFLHTLTQEQLSNILFPLGGMTKTAVREIAKDAGIKVHNKPGSQEICFIPDNDYRRFLSEHLKDKSIQHGNIIDENGQTVGIHQGIAFYTIGQRKGIGAHKSPRYVISIDAKTNTVVIGPNDNLFSTKLYADNVHWISRTVPDKPIIAQVKIRYKHAPAEATIIVQKNNTATITFNNPQRAVTPGQSVVFFIDNVVLGGGIIKT